MKRASFGILCVVFAASCVERSRELSRSEREQVREYVSEEPTSPEHDLDIAFEDKIELIGYDVSTETWSPGETLTVTWHWKVNRALEDGWRLFTHVADGNGANQLNEDGNGVVRDLYQPGRWKAGEYVRDRQEITLPNDWASDRAVFYLGLWNGPHRLSVTTGAHDDENRARPLTVRTERGAAPAEERRPNVPTLDARKVSQAPEIDGRLDGPWTQVRETDAFRNTMTGRPAEFRAVARALWDDENLYIGFDVADDYLKSSFREQDDHLWEQDCVEIMVDPDGDGRNYFEMQVSPRGVSFDTRYDTRRVPQPIGHDDWQSELRAAVDVRGTIDDDDEDEGYTVEIAIPWSAFAHGTPPASRPDGGDAWRVNFYVMDSREEGQRAAGWSPPMVGDFHVPARFGRVRFVDPNAPAQGAVQGASQMTATPMLTPTAPQIPAIREQIQQRLTKTRDRAQEIERQARPERGEMRPTADSPSMM